MIKLPALKHNAGVASGRGGAPTRPVGDGNRVRFTRAGRVVTRPYRCCGCLWTSICADPGNVITLCQSPPPPNEAPLPASGRGRGRGQPRPRFDQKWYT